MSRDFWPSFCLKGPTWAPYEQMKMVSQTFSFCEDIHKKRVSTYSLTMLTPCLCSQRLRWHLGNYFTLENVKKNCNLIFSKIACWRSHRLRRHIVGVVNDNADTFGKLWWLLTDFKETIRPKRYFYCRCAYVSNSNNFKIWKSPYLQKK